MSRKEQYTQIIAILFLGLGWSLFVISSFNYQNFLWFPYLFWSRVLLTGLAPILATYIFIKKEKLKYIRLDTDYLTLSLIVQSSHGLLEPTNMIDFYSFVGIIYVLTALTFKGTTKQWVIFYLPIHLLALFGPMFFKTPSLTSSFANIIDHFSLIVAGSIIGTLIIKLNIDKQIALDKLVTLKEELLYEKDIQISQQKVLTGMATQVAHDIRSPLSALDMLLKDINDMPEPKRVLVRNSVNRIHDIANDLLQKNKAVIKGEKLENNINKKSKYLLSSLIETIVSEKRVSYRGMSNVSIETSLGTKAYGLFANVNQKEFKRVLSNLINNSIESFGDNKGQIVISLSSSDDYKLEVIIKDNGKGIPTKVLSKLGNEGETHGKKEGFGMGLYHSKKTIESWGGKFKVESYLGIGTKVSLRFKKENPPKTFVSKITLGSKDHIVVLDDDPAIHNIWDGRIESMGLKNISIHHFLSPEELIEWNTNNNADIYLIDYEYTNSPYNGLKIIKKLGLLSNTYLVTSRYEEEHIINQCESLNIGLIPKGLAGFLPLGIKQDNTQKKDVQTILLDDDELVRKAWKMHADSNGVDLKIYSTKKDLFENLSTAHFNSTFYIDANLGNGVKGNEVAKELHQMGYQNLILATGYEKSNFTELTHIKDVIGKNPFSLNLK